MTNTQRRKALARAEALSATASARMDAAKTAREQFEAHTLWIEANLQIEALRG